MPNKPTDVAGVAGRLLGNVRGLHVQHDVHPVLVPLPACRAFPHLVSGGGGFIITRETYGIELKFRFSSG
jgi:hypothetical protein